MSAGGVGSDLRPVKEPTQLETVTAVGTDIAVR